MRWLIRQSSRMAVMEYIEGNTEESAWPEDAREKIESLRVVQKLHAAQFVFGGYRHPTFYLWGRSIPRQF